MPEQAEAEAPVSRQAPPEPEVVHDGFRDCDVCPEMVVIPAGSFMMGGLGYVYAGQIHDDEGPIHRVTIERPFGMGVYEVTFDEWDAAQRGGDHPEWWDRATGFRIAKTLRR